MQQNLQFFQMTCVFARTMKVLSIDNDFVESMDQIDIHDDEYETHPAKNSTCRLNFLKNYKDSTN